MNSLFFWLRRTIVWRFRKPRYITLIGGPGAGKGTVAAALAPALGLPHLSTGALMRKEIAAGTDFGMQVKDLIEKGALVSDDLVLEILVRALRSPENSSGVILDGFPRTLVQAQKLDHLLSSWGVELEKAIWLELTEADLVERLSKRRTCSNQSCGRSYHLTFEPPRVADKCDLCQSVLIQRKDDQPDSIIFRLKTFKLESAALKNYYAGTASGVLALVTPNNSMSKEQVLAEVVSKLKS